MTGRRVFPRRTWDEPEDRPRTTVTVWVGLTSWLLGVDVERDVDEWTGMIRVGPFGLSVTRWRKGRSLWSLARDWWSIPIDWYGVGVTRGGFFGWLGMPVEYEEWPDGRRPVEAPAVVAAGGWCAPFRSDEGSVDGWSRWGSWYHVRRIHLSDFLEPLSAPRVGIRYIDAPRSIP